MRAALASVLAAFALAPAAAAAAPPLTVSTSAARGTAPLKVVLTASEGADAYHWSFGDGSTAEGRVVEHVYAAAGAYTAAVEAAYADGTTATASVGVTAYTVTLGAPRARDYGRRGRFGGSVQPAIARAPVRLYRRGTLVASGRTDAAGRFALSARVTTPGPWTVRVADLASGRRSVLVRPVLTARLVGSDTVGAKLRLEARLRPAGAGKLRVRIWRNGRRSYEGAASRVRLTTARAASFRVSVEVDAERGFAYARRTLRTVVVEPRLTLGSTGPAVRELERRLDELHYALPSVDGRYDLETYQAVLAFQKVVGLPWTGTVEPRTWHALGRAHIPRAQYRGDHIEISKSRQVLFVVRGGRVAKVVHVSTGATGNTPLGRWHVYRKVVGWDWVLWYPMYFLRGFAIHGYPEVPAFPASHGCVRVPMWIAPQLFATNPYGQTVYVYW